jgi:hypothetical protein
MHAKYASSATLKPPPVFVSQHWLHESQSTVAEQSVCTGGGVTPPSGAGTTVPLSGSVGVDAGGAGVEVLFELGLELGSLLPPSDEEVWSSVARPLPGAGAEQATARMLPETMTTESRA